MRIKKGCAVVIPKGKKILLSNGAYHNHTNSSYKKLTEAEKKQVEFLSRIHRMKHKARILGDLRFITNAILSNCAYHEKNIEDQFKKMEKLNVPKKEIEVITKAWEVKNKLGKALLNDLGELIKYVEENNN